VHGLAGDRFAIRNSGAHAVVEGVGVQACEHMTRGRVVILKSVGSNVGAGMTGGALYLPRSEVHKLNSSYVGHLECEEADTEELRELVEEHYRETSSPTAASLLADWAFARRNFVRVLPLARIPRPQPSADRKSTDGLALGTHDGAPREEAEQS